VKQKLMKVELYPRTGRKQLGKDEKRREREIRRNQQTRQTSIM
jgi:hypothetical protein